MSRYVLDCDAKADTCTMVPYSPPAATVDHYAIGPTWALVLVAIVVVLIVITTAIVRYKAHTERGDTERQRILHPPPKCPTCGWDLEGKS